MRSHVESSAASVVAHTSNMYVSRRTTRPESSQPWLDVMGRQLGGGVSDDTLDRSANVTLCRESSEDLSKLSMKSADEMELKSKDFGADGPNAGVESSKGK